MLWMLTPLSMSLALFVACLSSPCGALSVSSKTRQEAEKHNPDCDEGATVTEASSLSFGGRPKPNDPAFATAVAAASHCVDLDRVGESLARQTLGIFELKPSRNSYRVTSAGVEIIGAEVKLGFRRLLDEVQEDEGESTLRSVGAELGAISLDILLEVSLQPAFGLASDGARHSDIKEEGAMPNEGSEQSGNAVRLQPTPVNTHDVTGNGKMLDVEATGLLEAENPSARVDVVLAYGTHGHWGSAQTIVPLEPKRRHTGDSMDTADDAAGGDGESNSEATTMAISASFEWVFEANMKDLLGSFLVADVKITSTDLAHQNTDHLLHATLCKAASGGETTAKLAGSELRAVLTPIANQNPGARRVSSATGGIVPMDINRSRISRETSIAAEGSLVILAQMDDPEWTTESGRGMGVVNALPRLTNWKPGEWKKRQRRRQRQEEERERRRSRTQSEKYDNYWGAENRRRGGSGGRSSNGGIASRSLKRAVDGIKSHWRRFWKRQV